VGDSFGHDYLWRFGVSGRDISVSRHSPVWINCHCGSFIIATAIATHVCQVCQLLEPVRQKLQGFANTVQQMIHDEIFAFKFEWGQYLLLTNEDAGTDDGDPSKTTTPLSSSIPEPKKKKSVVFRMIKPFLKARKRVFGRKASKQRKDTEMTGTSCEPPTTTTTTTTTTTVEAGVPIEKEKNRRS
jgi:hypothetical protein